MMLDADIVAVSPSSVWRVLRQAGLLSKWNGKPSKKGTGFAQPLAAHQHWHIDVSYINICGTFYYLCSVLDGYSRYIVHWDIRESMTEADIEIILQRAKEMLPGSAAADHLRQRAAVHRQGLQGVHSDLGHDARQDLAVLPAIERENRALAQIAQRGVHPAGNAVVAGRCAAPGRAVRGPLQQCPPEQRHGLHHCHSLGPKSSRLHRTSATSISWPHSILRPGNMHRGFWPRSRSRRMPRRQSLLKAIETLRAMNQTEQTAVPRAHPVNSCPDAGGRTSSMATGSTAPIYELCVLSELSCGPSAPVTCR